MTIDFHNPNNRQSYAFRKVDQQWKSMIGRIVDLKDKVTADIGCGGGLYTNVLAQLGARQVIGMDYSREMLKTAQEQCIYPDIIEYRVGNALEIPLEDMTVDVILERAVIHHLQDLETCFQEAFRVLKPNGSLMVQDRTTEDCFLPGSHEHIRGYFFEHSPQLIEKEQQRRHQSETVQKALIQAGFKEIQAEHLWEKRREYLSFDELREDILSRKGRSLLHALSDSELKSLVHHLEVQVDRFPIIEKDRWTIWNAVK